MPVLDKTSFKWQMVIKNEKKQQTTFCEMNNGVIVSCLSRIGLIGLTVKCANDSKNMLTLQDYKEKSLVCQA